MPRRLRGGKTALGRLLRAFIAVTTHLVVALGILSLGVLAITELKKQGTYINITSMPALEKIGIFYFTVFNTSIYSVLEASGLNSDKITRIALSISALGVASLANISFHYNLFIQDARQRGLTNAAIRYLNEGNVEYIDRVDHLVHFSSAIWGARAGRWPTRTAEEQMEALKTGPYLHNLQDYCGVVFPAEQAESFVLEHANRRVPLLLHLLAIARMIVAFIASAPLFALGVAWIFS